MSQSLAIPRVIPEDWKRLDLIINKIKLHLGSASSPTFVGLTPTGLTASRLVWTNAAKALASKDLVDLVAGTANQIIIADDSSGGVILTTPQDIHVDATPEFAGITIKNSSDNVIFYVDDDEMYFTASVVIPIAAGHGMPWLFWFTYAAP